MYFLSAIEIVLSDDVLVGGGGGGGSKQRRALLNDSKGVLSAKVEIVLDNTDGRMLVCLHCIVLINVLCSYVYIVLYYIITTTEFACRLRTRRRRLCWCVRRA